MSDPSAPSEDIIDPSYDDDLSVNTEDSIDLVLIARQIQEAKKKRKAATRLASASSSKKKKTTTSTKKVTKKQASTAANPKQPRQKNYIGAEDLLLCHAYISASENSINGNKVKGPDFQRIIEQNYAILLQEHIRKESQLAKRNFEVTKKNMPSTPADKLVYMLDIYDYPERTGAGLLKRFKVVAAACMKFLSIEKQSPLKSGENPETATQRYQIMYHERYNTKFPFHWLKCCDFLRDKAKWQTVNSPTTMTNQQGSDSNDNSPGSGSEDSKNIENKSALDLERPMGKKMAMKLKETTNIVASVTSKIVSNLMETDQMKHLLPTERVSTSPEAAKSVDHGKKMQFLSDASNALQIFAEHMMLDGLPTPDRMEVKKQKAELYKAQLRAKMNLLETNGDSPCVMIDGPIVLQKLDDTESTSADSVVSLASTIPMVEEEQL